MNTLPRIVSFLGFSLAHFILALPAIALDSDKDAPVTINADTTNIDFRTGKRVLSGNVDITQGTLNIRADKIVLIYKGDEIDTATAYGKPVRFKQLPEGQKQMVHGEGITLELKQAKNLITLQQNAKITQGSNTITGKVIYYNTKTSKMTVKSQSSGTQKNHPVVNRHHRAKKLAKKQNPGEPEL